MLSGNTGRDKRFVTGATKKTGKRTPRQAADVIKHQMFFKSNEEKKSARLPRILKPPGITRERQEYLHTQITEHVWPEYRAITCPPPR